MTISRRVVNPLNPKRTCPLCGEPFIATNGRSAYCTPAHRIAFDRLWEARGKILGPLAAVWRTGKRGRTADRAYALAELCRLLDLYAAEDKAAGRRPDVVVARRRESGWSAADVG